MHKLNELIIENQDLSCPIHQHLDLNPDDELILPLHKRVIVQYSDTPSGTRELHLYHDDKEISFDEPDLFEFGESLAKQSRFIAWSATEWGSGYEWPRIQELLEQLIEEGILHYADIYEAETAMGQDGSRPSPLPPASDTVPRSWLECAAITSELTGRTLELGYLELVIPIFRIAHIALDAEGRQVGEANVFPKALRLDIPTDWRTCPYPGSRYQDERPMNVTALKSMRAYWPQMMAALLNIREAYLQRFPEAQYGWTVGGLEALSTLVLAVSTYQLMRSQHRVENGQLHPALSSMFRVTDGLRMVMHQMIFVPFGEPTISPNAPMTSQEIYEYSERNYAFSSEYGVCAGPKVMIEEFLNVLVNGVPIKDAESVVLDAPVQAALADLNPAFDYGLYGLQVHAIVFSIWPVMTRTYVQLGAIMDAWAGDNPDAVLAFRERLQKHLHILKTQTHHATEAWRVTREQAYSDIYKHCALGLGLPPEEKMLTERIAPVLEVRHVPVFEQLGIILHQHFSAIDATNSPDIKSLQTCLMNYFLQVQAIVRLACETQQHINKLLGREYPNHPFDAVDIDIHNLLQGREARKIPYLTNELEEIFKLGIAITKDSIEITEVDFV
jgi:hypothetical protein